MAGIATTLQNLLQGELDSAWTALPGLMAGVGVLFGAGFGLYMVMVILSYMFTGEASKLPFMDLVKRLIFFILVCTFALNGDFYIKHVKEPVLLIPDEVGQLVSKNNQSTDSIIDTMFKQNFKTVAGVWQQVGETSWWNIDVGLLIEALLVTVVVLVLGTLFIVIAFAYLAIAKILINVVLLIGPMFIMFSFFPPLREYFMKWVGAVLNYIFLVVIYAAVFTFLHNVLTGINMKQQAKDMMVGDAATEAITASGGQSIIFLFVYLVFIGVIMAVPTLASSLTGGVGISPFGQVSQLGGMLKNIMPRMPKSTGASIGSGKAG